MGGERCGLRHPVRYTDRSELRSPLAFFSNLQADAADVAKTKIVDLPYEELTCMHVPPHTHARARAFTHALARTHWLPLRASFPLFQSHLLSQARPTRMRRLGLSLLLRQAQKGLMLQWAR